MELPTFAEFETYSSTKKQQFIKLFREKVNCQQEQLYEKWIEWCTYIKTHITSTPIYKKLEEIPNDTNEFFKWWSKKSSQRGDSSISGGGRTTPTSVNPRHPCYDHNYCSIPSLATASHVLMGILALFFCVAGILLNMLLIPVFNLAGIRSSATIYMTGIAVCDILSAILMTLLVVIRNLPVSFTDQLTMYQSFTAYLLSFGWPLKELVDLLGLWILVALLVDRFLYRRHGYSLEHLFNRIRCVRVIVILTILLTLYTVPKFLKYKLVEQTADGGHTIVSIQLTQLGQSVAFKSAVLWLEMLLEYLLPYILLSVFGTIIGMSVFRQCNQPKHRSDSSLNSETPDEKIQRREGINSYLTIWIALLVMVCKFPSFLLHCVMLSTTGNQTEHWHQLGLAAQFMEVVCICGKPIIYLYFGSHIRRAMMDMFCLFFRPGHTHEITLAGGLGSVVELKSSVKDRAVVPRSETTTTLLSNRHIDFPTSEKQQCLDPCQLESYMASGDLRRTSSASSQMGRGGGDVAEDEKDSVDSGVKVSGSSSKNSSRQPLMDADPEQQRLHPTTAVQFHLDSCRNDSSDHLV